MKQNDSAAPVVEPLTKEQLSERINLPVATIEHLRKSRKIPFLKLGYRTIRFEVEKVQLALRKTEVLAVFTSSRGE